MPPKKKNQSSVEELLHEIQKLKQENQELQAARDQDRLKHEAELLELKEKLSLEFSSFEGEAKENLGKVKDKGINVARLFIAKSVELEKRLKDAEATNELWLTTWNVTFENNKSLSEQLATAKTELSELELEYQKIKKACRDTVSHVIATVRGIQKNFAEDGMPKKWREILTTHEKHMAGSQIKAKSRQNQMIRMSDLCKNMELVLGELIYKSRAVCQLPACEICGFDFGGVPERVPRNLGEIHVFLVLCFITEFNRKSRPKLFPECGHTLCQQCALKLCKDSCVQCPFDLEFSELKKTGTVDDLPKSLTIMTTVDIWKQMAPK